MAGEPNAGAYVIDPGILYVGGLDAVEPTSVSSSWDSTWYKLGYTEAGSTFTYTPTITPHYVAEEYEPIRYRTENVLYTVSFQLDEFTKRNLTLVMNGGVVTSPDNQNWSLEPVAPGAEQRVMLGWDVSAVTSTNPARRFIWRQCVQTGAVALAMQKNAPTAFSTTFSLEKPITGSKPWKVWGAGALNAA